MSGPFLNTIYYFGCWQRSGHYLHAPGMRSCSMFQPPYSHLCHLDGKLAPLTGEAGEGWEPQFKAKAWRLSDFTPTPYSALSWWDRSVDTRGKCNSIIFAPGHTVTAEDILLLAKKHYPEVMGRLPEIEVLAGWHEKARAA